MKRFLKQTSLLLLVLLALPLLGCGSDRPATIRTSGKVTFNGGPPPAEGMVQFTTITPAEGYDRRPGRGKFDTSGNYKATSFTDGDGLVPGTYRVRVECWKTPPSMEGTPGVSYVPAVFQKEIVIEPGSGSQTFDIDVPQE